MVLSENNSNLSLDYSLLISWPIKIRNILNNYIVGLIEILLLVCPVFFSAGVLYCMDFRKKNLNAGNSEWPAVQKKDFAIGLI